MSLENMLPPGARKFRENSADSVVYNCIDHSAEQPSTLTISRQLPVPRKGNPGTVKMFINRRKSIVLDRSGPNERVVPFIVKIETSAPVGTDLGDVTLTLQSILALLDDSKSGSQDDFRDLYLTGMLPNEDYSAPAGI